jgi:hypothetical protein
MIEEVIHMTPSLQPFMDSDKGFHQYCAQYHRVASDPAVQDEYYRWVNEQMRQQGMMIAAEERGEKRGEENVITVLNEIGVSPDILRQVEAKLNTDKQNSRRQRPQPK